MVEVRMVEVGMMEDGMMEVGMVEVDKYITPEENCNEQCLG